MEEKTGFNCDIFHLSEPIPIVGCAARVVFGTPEHMPTIDRLIGDFFAQDVPATIPGRVVPCLRLGICAEWTPETGTFTYMMGDQVESIADLPAGTRGFTLPAGDYARVRFSAPDKGQLVGPALGEGYARIGTFIDGLDAWRRSDLLIDAEVYEARRFESAAWPEMDIWTLLEKKSQ